VARALQRAKAAQIARISVIWLRRKSAYQRGSMAYESAGAKSISWRCLYRGVVAYGWRIIRP